MVTSTAETIRQPSQPAITGGLLVLLAAVGFSAKAVLVKLAYAYSPRLDAITLMSMRMLMSLPVFLLAAIWSHRGGEQAPLTSRDLAAVVCLGFLGFYLAGFLDFAGLGYISAGLERLILFLYPTLVVLFSALFLGRSITRRERYALLLSYLGIALVFATDTVTHSPQLWLGSVLVFGAALSFAVYILGSGHFLRRIGSRRLTGYVMSCASVVTLIHFSLGHHGTDLLKLPLPVYGITAVMAIFSTVIPAFLLNAGMQRIGANATAIISSIGPVMTLFLAHVLLGENMSAMQLAGTTLIIAGVVIVSMRAATAEEGR